MAMLETILGLALLVLLLFLFLLACKPWRFFSRSRPIKVGDLERPLVSEDLDPIESQINELERRSVSEEFCIQNEGHFGSPRTQALVYNQMLSSPNLVQGETWVADVISEPSEEVLVGQTLKHPLGNYLSEEQKRNKKQDSSNDSRVGLENDRFKEFVPKDLTDRRSCLTLEIISGPSRSLCCSVQSSNIFRLPLTLGRVSPSDLLLKDSEVSGKHVMITSNLNAVHHSGSESRQWGSPIELANGNIITLGPTSTIYVQITPEAESLVPFRFGIATDPMSLHRGGKKLPMEDVCFHQWPLHGVDQFGLFGICDGHGGAVAAKSASKLVFPFQNRILPEMVAEILSDLQRRDRVLSQHDASDVLRDALSKTEAFLNHHYEGCTATALLVWADGCENFSVQ